MSVAMAPKGPTRGVQTPNAVRAGTEPVPGAGILRAGRRPGYTLIEVLVAMALVAMLATLVAQTFRAAAVARERIHAHLRLAAGLRRAYDVIARDLHSSVLPPDDTGLLFGIAATPAAAGSSVLQLASAVGDPLLAGRVANETVLVQYAVMPDPRTEAPTLWRFETPYPLPDDGSGQPAAPDPSGQNTDTRSTPLLPGVTGVTFLFYSLSQQNWVETWEGETGLPDAVRMDLLFEDPNGRAEPRQESWVFHLPAARGADAPAGATDAPAGATDAAAGTGGAGGGA